jgi:serine/threonine-protein kinase
MDSAAIKPGQILAGKYQVERVLGRGGMGVVLAARHMFMARPVAIKLMTAVGMASGEQEARFFREAQIAGMLKGEHAGKVWDCGKLEDGTPFIEMELLEGKDLAGVLKLRGAMTIEEAVSYVLEASEAVAEAHALGIVHRDLKPANLFLANISGGKPRIKVLDFGISKLAADDGKLTKTEQTFGSPQYMSPEQVQSAKRVDARTDVWALGVILYEFLAETTPFAQESSYATMAAVVTYPPKPLATLRPDLPPGLVQVVMQCLQKNPDLRFPNVSALAEALGPYAPQEMKRYVQVANAGRVKVVHAGPGAHPWPPEPNHAPDPRAAMGSAPAMTPPMAHSTSVGQGSGATPPVRRRDPGLVAAAAITIVAGSIAAITLVKGRELFTSPSSTVSAVPTPAATIHEQPTAAPSVAAPAAIATPTAAPSVAPDASAAPIASVAPLTAPPASPSATSPTAVLGALVHHLPIRDRG